MPAPKSAPFALQPAKPAAADFKMGLATAPPVAAAFAPGPQAQAGTDRGQADAAAEVQRLVDEGQRLFLLQNYGEAEALLRKAVRQMPRSAPAQLMYAMLLQNLGRIGEAIDHFKAAIQADPKNAQAFTALAGLLWGAGEYTDAQALFAHALTCDPGHAIARARLLHADGHLADWSRFAARPDDVELLRTASANVEPFAVLPLADDPFFQRTVAERYARLIHAGRQEVPLEPQVPRAGGKIRIGYFSNDFFSHATMFLIGELFSLHDRDRFEVVLYDYGSRAQDEQHTRARTSCDLFRDVADLDDRAIAMQARADGIDVAIDLKGYTEKGRTGIFAVRAAPVQVSFLGYPGTLGMPEMDYILADPIVIPPEMRDGCTEKVLAMPQCYQVNDSTREVPAEAPSRAELGLPEDAFVFCSFNNTYKVSLSEFGIWMRLLQRVPGSVLWCFAAHAAAEANLRAEAEKRGVAADRIIFAKRVPHEDHMARHRQADLFLDTFAVNAHTTASDALLAGVPVVTKLGRQFAARVAGSILKAAGMSELVTETEAEYEALALRLARDPEELGHLRVQLQQGLRQSPLYDTAQFARDLETGLEMVVARQRSGAAPQHLQIGA
ncbi:tetratricopeptide repeat protein [Cribrihabitans pelagius]|uniref:O-linked N-acetylglucosamine transferase, SPINDLY family protein n=1 Tax=Cribrihabitans pelagius TaxID=1765746 RepID=UPI003B5AF9B8